jgi:hypothetical protein
MSASTIVHGKVVETSSRWNEAHTLIVTDVRVDVLATAKGDPGATVTLTQPGGRVGKLRVDVPGASPFRAGQEVVLFLREGPDGRLQVPGLSRGRFDVNVDPESARRFVLGIPPVERAGKPSSPESRLEWTEVDGRVSLDRFLDDLRWLADQPAEAPHE